MAGKKEILEAQQAAKALNEEIGYLEDAFTSIGQKIKDEIEYNLIDVNKETQKVGEAFSKNIGSAISQNAASLKKIGNLQSEINKGVNVEAKIQKEIAAVATRKRTIQRQQNNLIANGIKLDKETSNQLSAQFAIQEDTLSTLISENVEKQKQKSLLTLLGEGGKNLLDKLDKSGTASKLFSGNLADTVTPMRLLEVGIALIVDAFLELDKITGEVAQNLGISYSEAQGMNKEFSEIAMNSQNVFVTTAGVAKSQMELSNIFGTNKMLTNDMLQTQTELTHQMGLSAETGGELAKLGLLTGKTSKEITANVLGQSAAMNAANKTAISEKNVLKEVAGLSSSIQLSMGNNAPELAKAVQTAKKFGMELSKVDSIADSLMDFESSITAELEAEMLLGRDINLEKARQFALTNNLAGVAEEVAKITGSAADFSKMGRIEQEALAKAVGMSKEDLAKSLQDKEILAKLGAKEGTALEAYNKLKKAGNSEEQIRKKLGDDNLAAQLHGESVQERFAASVASMKEVFVQIADALLPIGSSIVDAVAGMANLVKNSLGFLKILGSITVAYQLLRVLGDANYRNQIKTNIAAKFSNKEGEKNIAQKLISNTLGKDGLITQVKENAQLALGGIYEKSSNLLKKSGLVASAKDLAIATQKSLLEAKGFIVQQAKLGLIYAQNIAERAGNIISTIGNTIKKKGLLASIADMAMRAFSSLSAIPFVGPILGIAGAAAALALGYSYYNKADDMVSPGAGSGYGSRTIMGPEGAIALNNKDTVIAGTDLFPSQPGAASSPQNNNIVVAEVKRTNQLLQSILNRSNKSPVIKMNDVKLGTAVDMGAFSVQ